MEKKYTTLKLNEKELKVLKNILAQKVVEYLCEKSKPDYEEKVAKEFEKYDKLYKEHNYCKKILDIIEYLER